MLSQRPYGVDESAPDVDDHRVRRAQMLLGAVNDRTHADLNGTVLWLDGKNARVALRSRDLAIDEKAVRQVSSRPPSFERIVGVR